MKFYNIILEFDGEIETMPCILRSDIPKYLKVHDNTVTVYAKKGMFRKVNPGIELRRKLKLHFRQYLVPLEDIKKIKNGDWYANKN